MSDKFQVTELRLSSMTSAQAFDLTPDGSAIAKELDISAARKVRFKGSVEPLDRKNWVLHGHLGATVVQPCIATLAAVTTRIDVPVERRFLHDYTLPEDSETEVPDDDTEEPLPETLDLMAVLLEALALALPDYPRADGVAPVEQSSTPPGSEPITSAEVKPFASLADLKRRMEND